MKQVEISPNRQQSYLLDFFWKNLQDTVKTKERNPLIQTSQPLIPSIVQNPLVIRNPSRAMAARFVPLALSIVLHDLPQNYS